MCSTEPHLHTAITPGGFTPGTYLLVIDHTVVAAIPNHTLADRIATLLNEHGLADTPDTLAPIWPPPTGTPT